jgi:hypothetical protein
VRYYSEYPDYIGKDFDNNQEYEESILKVLNKYAKLPITNPFDSDKFNIRYAKPLNIKEDTPTIFLNIDGTLAFIS